jgi:hypothetical protein
MVAAMLYLKKRKRKKNVAIRYHLEFRGLEPVSKTSALDNIMSACSLQLIRFIRGARTKHCRYSY